MDAYDRFIPAHAGNGGAEPQARPQLAVHPRARGERKVAGGVNFDIYGMEQSAIFSQLLNPRPLAV